MDGVSNSWNGALKKYCRRRRYWRIDGGTKLNRKKVKIAAFGGNSRRFGRAKATPKSHFKIAAPLKLWSKLKNAYVKMMLNLAGGDAFGRKRISKARRRAPAACSKDEFDRRLGFEIYKSLRG